MNKDEYYIGFNRFTALAYNVQSSRPSSSLTFLNASIHRLKIN